MNPYMNGHHLKVERLPFSDRLRGVCIHCSAWAEQTALGHITGSAVDVRAHEWEPLSAIALQCRHCKQKRYYSQESAKQLKCGTCPVFKLIGSPQER